VINFRVSGIAAGAAFILSLIIGFASGAAFSAILLRAIVFALVFFALSGLGGVLVSRFLPELLSDTEAGGGSGDIDDYDISVPGSRVDISVGETPIEGAFPDDASEAVDDIAGSPSTGSFTTGGNAASSHGQGDLQADFSNAERSPLDQGKKTGYNQERDITDDIGSLVDQGDFAEGQTEALPDMGNIAEGYTEGESGQNVEAEDFAPPEEPLRVSSKKPTVADDFNPRELAKAIQSVLKKEEKG